MVGTAQIISSGRKLELSRLDMDNDHDILINVVILGFYLLKMEYRIVIYLTT